MNQPSSAQTSDLISKDILELMGVKNMSEEDRASTYKTMLETIQNRVISRIGDMLNDQDVAEWEEIVRSGDQARHHQFLQEKQIDLDHLYQEEAMRYKIEMTELAKIALKEQ